MSALNHAFKIADRRRPVRLFRRSEFRVRQDPPHFSTLSCRFPPGTPHTFAEGLNLPSMDPTEGGIARLHPNLDWDVTRPGFLR